MKKPSALVELLAELMVENLDSDVEAHTGSKALIFLTDEAAKNDDPIELNPAECRAAFASRSTVARLVEALDSEEATLSLHFVTMSDSSLEALERGFVAVDEE